MNKDKQIRVPPLWTPEMAYLIINFLETIIDAIRVTHGKNLAVNIPSTTSPPSPGPAIQTPSKTPILTADRIP
jgi:hypothetical protein